MRLWKLILVTVGIVAICLLCGLPVFGAPPKADVAAFLPSVDDAGRLIWTPTVLMDSGLTAAAPNTATGDSAALVDGKPRRLKWKAYIVFDGQPIPPGPTPPPVPPPMPPVPPPPVPPPVPPTPIEAAKALAISAAAKLPQAGLGEDAKKLAAVYKSLANQIPKTIDTIDKLIVANRYAREISLGPQRAAVWESWVKELGTWLDAQRTAGTIKTVVDCKAVWVAIGEGLASVKGGKR